MDPPPQGQTSPSPAWLGVGDAPLEQRARKGAKKGPGKPTRSSSLLWGRFLGMNGGKSLLCPVLVWEEGHLPIFLFHRTPEGRWD